MTPSFVNGALSACAAVPTTVLLTEVVARTMRACPVTGLGREGSAANVAARQLDERLLQWMKAIASGDECAFAALHSATISRIRTSVLRYVRDAPLADEVLGDCYWQIWRDACKFDPARGAVLGWIHSIARSRALDALRKRATFREHEVSLDDMGIETPGDAASPCTLLDEQRRDRHLRRLLQSIEPIQRQLLSLAFVVGLSHQEVAAHTGMPLGTVKSHVRRGLSALRQRCEMVGFQA